MAHPVVKVMTHHDAKRLCGEVQWILRGNLPLAEKQGILLCRKRLGSSRPAMAELEKPAVHRGVVQRGAGDKSDGVVVQKEDKSFGTGTLTEPRFTFQAWVKNGGASLGELHLAARAALADAFVDFVQNNHYLSPDQRRRANAKGVTAKQMPSAAILCGRFGRNAEVIERQSVRTSRETRFSRMMKDK
jgi:hypothetical protein